MKHFFAALLLIFFFISSVFAQFEEGATFALLGYSDQQLALINPPTEETILSDLGSVANILRIYEDKLFIVHSGDYANNGAGAEIWYAGMDEIENAYLNSTIVNWQILDVEDGCNPWDIYVSGNTAYISLTNENSVGVYDLENGTELATINDLNSPQGLIANSEYVLVAESGYGYGSRITLINKEDYSIAEFVDIGQNPQYAIIDEQDNFHILCSGRSWESVPASIYRYNTSSSQLDNFELEGNPGEIALITDSEGNSKVILGDEWAFDTPHLYAYNPETMELELNEAIPNWGGNSIIAIPGSGFMLGSTTDNRMHEYMYDYSSYEYFFQASAAVADLVYYEGTNSIANSSTLQPQSIILSNAWPNPFNSSTNISFNLPTQNKVELTLFDIMGRNVGSLLSGNLQAGEHKVAVNGQNLASGTYFVRLNTGNASLTSKIILVK